MELGETHFHTFFEAFVWELDHVLDSVAIFETFFVTGGERGNFLRLMILLASSCSRFCSGVFHMEVNCWDIVAAVYNQWPNASVVTSSWSPDQTCWIALPDHIAINLIHRHAAPARFYFSLLFVNTFHSFLSYCCCFVVVFLHWGTDAKPGGVRLSVNCGRPDSVVLKNSAGMLHWMKTVFCLF